MNQDAKANEAAMDHKGKAILKPINIDKGKNIGKDPEIPKRKFIQNQETNFIDIPQSKNYAYDIRQFPFNLKASMYGIFFLDSSGNPCFNFMRPYPKMQLSKPNFYSIPAPFTILSSADGLVLCRDFVYFNYHICNPFFNTPSSYRCLHRPSRPHETNTHAVLAIHGMDSIMPIFFVFCLVEQKQRGKGYYTVDAYSSWGDHWLPPRFCKPIQVGVRVVENSGISDSYGNAYWLTEAPHAIVRVGFDGEVVYYHIIEIEEYYPGVKMQLGRIRMHSLCLVCSSHLDVQFYELLDGEGDVASFDFVNWLNKAEHGIIRDVDIELVRFEKDPVLWVNGRVVFWQLKEVGESDETESSLHEMPRWVKVPDSVRDAIPYVFTKMLPSRFLNEYPEVEDD